MGTTKVKNKKKNSSDAKKAAPKNPVGYPPKFSVEVGKKIIDSLQAGNYPPVAVAAGGVGLTAHYAWIKRGKAEGSGPYKDYADGVAAAHGVSEQRYVYLIAKASATTWQAAAWMLERRYHERWAKRDRIEVEKPIEVISHQGLDMAKVSTATLVQMRETLARAKREAEESATE